MDSDQLAVVSQAGGSASQLLNELRLHCCTVQEELDSFVAATLSQKQDEAGSDLLAHKSLSNGLTLPDVQVTGTCGRQWRDPTSLSG